MFWLVPNLLTPVTPFLLLLFPQNELTAFKAEQKTDKVTIERLERDLIGLRGCDANHIKVATEVESLRQSLDKAQNENKSLQQEISALRKRIQTGRDELKKQRTMELERLLQRYQNVKNELESQQNIERLRAEKYLMKTLFPQTSTMR